MATAAFSCGTTMGAGTAVPISPAASAIENASTMDGKSVPGLQKKYRTPCDQSVFSSTDAASTSPWGAGRTAATLRNADTPAVSGEGIEFDTALMLGPPMLLVCLLDRNARGLDQLTEPHRVALDVLAEGGR